MWGKGGRRERAAGETIRNYKGKMEIIFAHVGVRKCVESIRGRKKRGTQQAIEGRGSEEGETENRICLCMYAEVLTLQFGGRGHPVSERLGAIYQRELSRGDTTAAGVRRPPAIRPVSSGGGAEVAAICDWAPTQTCRLPSAAPAASAAQRQQRTI